MSNLANTHTPEIALPPLVYRPDLKAQHVAMMEQFGIPASTVTDLQLAMLGRCQIIAAQEDGRWHLSISHPFRLPTWGEINAARDALIPAGIWLCQPMPPKEFWVNVHRFCLHLWEIHDRHLLEQWAYDGAAGDVERASAVVEGFLTERAL